MGKTANLPLNPRSSPGGKRRKRNRKKSAKSARKKRDDLPKRADRYRSSLMEAGPVSGPIEVKTSQRRTRYGYIDGAVNYEKLGC
jgi:hypothetical protein